MTQPNVIAVDAARLNTVVERAKTTPTAADAFCQSVDNLFRQVDKLAAEARRGLVDGTDDHTVGSYLVGVQTAAQLGLQAALADARKLEAFDGLLAAYNAILAGPVDEPSIELTGEYHTGLHCGLEDRDICDRYDACDYGFGKGVERALEWAYSVVETGLSLSWG